MLICLKMCIATVLCSVRPLAFDFRTIHFDKRTVRIVHICTGWALTCLLIPAISPEVEAVLLNLPPKHFTCDVAGYNARLQ